MGEAAALGAAFLWAVSGTLIKPVTRSLTGLPLNALRCLFAVPFLWLLMGALGLTGELAALPAGVIVGLLSSALVAIVFGDTLYFIALRRLDASQAFPISTSVLPVFTFVLAAVFLGETGSIKTYLGVILVIGGIYLVSSPRERGLLPRGLAGLDRRGLLLVLVAGVFWATSLIILRSALQDVNVIVANALRISFVALLLTALALPQLRRVDPRRLGPRPLLLAAATGILDFGVSGALFLTAIKLAGAAKTAVLTSLSPLFLVAFALVFLKEPVTRRLGLGVALSVAGVALLVR
ncbi:MAG: DMT family transporter [Chloroflexi bacterium]|nr:DMT family transporter [Chloroflexota bacterium]